MKLHSIKLDVRLQDETVWLTQPLMAELLQTTQQEGELHQEATIKKFLTVRQEGHRQVQRNLDFYNLDSQSAPICAIRG